MNATVREGETLDGKYRIERVLGEGGMGVVVQALHLHLGQRVALKLLRSEACTMPEAVARFLREARAAAQIQSDHVVRVTDVGTLPSGAPYMVMELLTGMDLGDVVRTRGPLPIAEAVDYVLQASEAIAAAHVLGIVHRDLKPSNLFLSQTVEGHGHVKVLDFGISKLGPESGANASPMNITSTMAIMGSPLYMSPEQIRSSKNVDARTDIWSLGVVLHELLCGSPVYEADTASALMAMIAADPPKPLRNVRHDASAGLEKVILRCLEKDRDRRYANISEMAAALVPFGSASGRGSADRISRIVLSRGQPGDSGSSPRPVSAAGAATDGSWARTASGSGPHSKRVLVGFAGLIFVGLILAGVLGGRWLWARRASDKQHEAIATAASPSTASASGAVPSSNGSALQPTESPQLPGSLQVGSTDFAAGTAASTPTGSMGSVGAPGNSGDVQAVGGEPSDGSGGPGAAPSPDATSGPAKKGRPVAPSPAAGRGTKPGSGSVFDNRKF